jgi:hypothetical protein
MLNCRYLILIAALTANFAFARQGAVGEMPSPPPAGFDPSIPLECTADINAWGFPSACNCVAGYEYDQKLGICQASPQGELTGTIPVNGKCGNADGSLLFEVWSYQGGVAPRPGDSTYRAKLMLLGQQLGLIERYAPSYESPDPDISNWTVDSDFVTGSKVLIEKQGNRNSGSEIYSVIVILRSSLTGEERLRDRVICTNQWNYLLP